MVVPIHQLPHSQFDLDTFHEQNIRCLTSRLFTAVFNWENEDFNGFLRGKDASIPKQIIVGLKWAVVECVLFLLVIVGVIEVVVYPVFRLLAVLALPFTGKPWLFVATIHSNAYSALRAIFFVLFYSHNPFSTRYRHYIDPTDPLTRSVVFRENMNRCLSKIDIMEERRRRLPSNSAYLYRLMVHINALSIDYWNMYAEYYGGLAQNEERCLQKFQERLSQAIRDYKNFETKVAQVIMSGRINSNRGLSIEFILQLPVGALQEATHRMVIGERPWLYRVRMSGAVPEERSFQEIEVDLAQFIREKILSQCSPVELYAAMEYDVATYLYIINKLIFAIAFIIEPSAPYLHTFLFILHAGVGSPTGLDNRVRELRNKNNPESRKAIFRSLAICFTSMNHFQQGLPKTDISYATLQEIKEIAAIQYQSKLINGALGSALGVMHND